MYFILPIIPILIYNKKDKKQHTTSKLTEDPKRKNHLGTTANIITEGGGGGASANLQLLKFLGYLVILFAWKMPSS